MLLATIFDFWTLLEKSYEKPEKSITPSCRKPGRDPPFYPLSFEQCQQTAVKKFHVLCQRTHTFLTNTKLRRESTWSIISDVIRIPPKFVIFVGIPVVPFGFFCDTKHEISSPWPYKSWMAVVIIQYGDCCLYVMMRMFPQA